MQGSRRGLEKKEGKNPHTHLPLTSLGGERGGKRLKCLLKDETTQTVFCLSLGEVQETDQGSREGRNLGESAIFEYGEFP